MRTATITESSQQPPIGMVMTPRAFEEARASRVVSIRANPESMHTIARAVGSRTLTPLMLVARHGSSPIGTWDETVPTHQSNSHHRYFPAGELNQEDPISWDRPRLVQYARQVIGAQALTEITLYGGWDPEKLVTHAKAFGRALIDGERPLVLEPRRHLAAHFIGGLFEQLGDAFGSKPFDRLTTHQLSHLSPPFIIEYANP